MRAAPVLLLACIALSGCTALQGLLDQAQGKPRFAETTKVDEHLDFALTDAPPQQQSYEFNVDPGTTVLAVDVGVRFTDLGTPVALPQSGQVSVNVTSPQGQELAQTFGTTNSTELRRDNPAAGTWAVQVATLGQGSVRVLVVATVPVRP